MNFKNAAILSAWALFTVITAAGWYYIGKTDRAEEDRVEIARLKTRVSTAAENEEKALEAAAYWRKKCWLLELEQLKLNSEKSR